MTDDQAAVFEQVRAILRRHVPPFVVIKDEPGKYELTSPKPATIGARKLDSVWFAGLSATKSGVTLHFMPVYGDPGIAEKLSPVFMRTLKGKACFHLGNFPPELAEATEQALEFGLEAYRARGWL